MLAQLIYLTAGLFLPVFAGEGTGLMYLIGAASGGYLLAYPVAAALVGYLSRDWKSVAGAGLSAVAGAVVIFTIGVVWLHYAAGHATWMESIDRGFLRFIAIDAAKIMFVGLLYSGSRRLA
jgi:biotin transport system substrate-specific component